jgi:hypothetical protein
VIFILSHTQYEKEALFEHRFWLQILEDHARFIFASLPQKEGEDMRRAYYFIDVFERLVVKARHDIFGDEIVVLNHQANQYAQEFHAFKLYLLRENLQGKLFLFPTLLNHMVSEVEEYLRILCFLLSGEVPPRAHPIHHHLLWLSDSIAHSVAITDHLDMGQKRERGKSAAFTESFQAFYLQAVELAGYLRSNLLKFPALIRFTGQVELEVLLFQSFLQEIEELGIKAQVLGLHPLLPNHMARESCYYLMKVTDVSGSQNPDCDPTLPHPIHTVGEKRDE